MAQLKEITGTVKLTDKEYDEVINCSEENNMGFDEIITSCVKHCIKTRFI